MAILGTLFRKVLKVCKERQDLWVRQELLDRQVLQEQRVLKAQQDLQALLEQQEPLDPQELTVLRLRYLSELSRLELLARRSLSQ
jgi:DNA-directed RNA polymerase specialized sigma subunit